MSTVKRECRVVMLPTEKANCDCKPSPDGNTYHIYSCGLVLQNSKLFLNGKKANLYILSDDEIKDGDWIYHPLDVKPIHFYQTVDLIDPSSYGYKKIIATTDSSLSQVSRAEIPQPSSAFIQKYIDAYNSGEPIEKVMVEMVEYKGIEWLDRPLEYFPKVNPKDNTITISKVKDSWTREEMIDFAWKTLVQGRKASTSMKDLFNELPEWFDKWVEENL